MISQKYFHIYPACLCASQPWFPTRKASKLTFVCFQLQFFSPCKSHREKIISFIFLQSTHQVDMKNIAECQKEFFAYCNALETRGVMWRAHHLFTKYHIITAPIRLVRKILTNWGNYFSGMRIFLNQILAKHHTFRNHRLSISITF